MSASASMLTLQLLKLGSTQEASDCSREPLCRRMPLPNLQTCRFATIAGQDASDEVVFHCRMRARQAAIQRASARSLGGATNAALHPPASHQGTSRLWIPPFPRHVRTFSGMRAARASAVSEPCSKKRYDATQHQRLDDQTLAVVESLLGSLLANANPSDAAAIIATDVVMRTEVPIVLLTSDCDTSAAAAAVKRLLPFLLICFASPSFWHCHHLLLNSTEGCSTAV